MSKHVTLEDARGEVKRAAQISETATISRLIPALITQMELPVADPFGRPVTYHLALGDKRLQEDETLSSAGVKDGDTLTMVPEMTAGPAKEFLTPKYSDPDRSKGFPEDANYQQSHCAFLGSERQHLVQEITEAVEARLLVSIVTPRQEAKKADADAHSAMVVRPVFGAPVSSATLDCDVFMIMPFAEAFQSIYKDYIKPVATDAKLIIRRADDFYSQHNIMNEIWTALCVCRFAIADCTGRNPNVLYELGIAHTLGKRVILLSQSAEDIPFDVQGRRVIIYEDRAAGLKYLQNQLTRAVEVILAELQSEDTSDRKK